MNRKIVKHGMSTLTVSLPAKWVKKHQLQQGDEISIIEKDQNLLISMQKMKEKEIHLTLPSSSERYIRSYLGRAYKKGYSTIHLSFSSSDTIVAIKHAVANLSGAEILDAGKSHCIVHIFPIEDTKVDIEEFLRKMILTLKTMHTIIYEDMNTGKYPNAATLEELRNNNWKTRDFILRYASLKNVPYDAFSVLEHITFCIEKIGTKLNNFYKRHLVKKKGKQYFPKELYMPIQNAYTWLINSLSKQEPLSFEKEIQFRDGLLTFILRLLNMKSNDITIITYFIAEMLDSVVSFISLYKEQ